MKIQTNFYRLLTHGSLLSAECFYSWDNRVAMGFTIDARNIILNHFQDKTWALFYDARNWQVDNHIAESIFSKITRPELSETLTHIACVTGDKGNESWKNIGSFKENSHYKVMFFPKKQDAETWLKAAGYKLTQ